MALIKAERDQLLKKNAKAKERLLDLQLLRTEKAKCDQELADCKKKLKECELSLKQ